MDDGAQAKRVTAGDDTHRTAMMVMVAIFGGSLVGGAMMLAAFLEFAR